MKTKNKLVENYKGVSIIFTEGSEYPYEHKCLSELARYGFSKTGYKTLKEAKEGIDKFKK